MSEDILSSAVAAVCATTSETDRALASETRLRVRRSLERRADGHRKRVGWFAAIALLLGGTVSWALGTGRIGFSVPTPTMPSVPAILKLPLHAAVAPPPVAPAPPPPVIAPQPPPIMHVAVAPKPPPIEAVVPDFEPLYRSAHDLHFHAHDYGAALVAWDAYLASDPSGRFAVEARFNRAITLVKLARVDEARVALRPFADGEVQPVNYRRDEATALLEKLH